MRIAFIGIKGLPAKWGADRAVEAIIQRLATHHDITVYCSSHQVSAGTIYPGVRLIRVPCLRGKTTHMISVNVVAAIHAVFCGHYDLIHLHNIEAAFMLPLLRLRYKVVSTAHGRITEGNKWNKVTAGLMKLMEFPFCWLSSVPTSVSITDALQMSNQYGCKVLCIPNGVETKPYVDLAAAHSLLASLNLIEHRYLIFAAGRIIPLKGIHLLIQAIQAVDKEWRLLVVGDLSQSSDYAAQLKAMSDDRVVFIPYIASLSKLLGLVQLSSLFVFPSTSEAMSMMLVEAASTGVPILCSDIPANTAIMPAQTLFFSNGNVEDLARKLIWALHHSDEMRKRSRSIQDAVIKKYSWDLIAVKYEDLYYLLEKTKHVRIIPQGD